ncbi:3-oxoacyl-[acyl-carrier-protein] reductase FabG [Pseudomonas sp. 37 R 15]|uniref:SDR family NAD(P)-dependent oxidoreductase n=1 Tax=Pseudomonas sp. 37 R 15 TaxID=1844104 RepID=UPI0008120A3C|nr:SDR family NAD(P)-dependent oxidoreductase [Pseudomonas sp. 37 R 15]CRM79599.1 3-oxoacyl-[acyl-carrier-protein] reductase FabG [Pseudomonas sp. 37 R 15]
MQRADRIYTRATPEALRGKVALVTGGARGLGLEICRQLVAHGALVVLCARKAGDIEHGDYRVAADIAGVDVFPLDVSDALSIEHCRAFVIGKYGRLDILVNNAGVFLDDPRKDVHVCHASQFADTLTVNLVGTYAVTDAFISDMRRHNYGRIVNVSSGMGRCVELDGTAVAYRTSKAAVNTLTKILADRERPYNIKINSVCPGWIRTDMGGDCAPRSAAAGALGVLIAASLPDDGYSGQLLRDGERLGCS